MKDDVKRVNDRLAGPEREKFEAYLHAYESMSDRQSKLRELAPVLAKVAPKLTDGYRANAPTSKRLEAQFEVAAAALIGGLTNVATICSGLCGVDGTFTGLEVAASNHGTMGHQKSQDGKDWKQLFTMLHRFHLEQVAKLIRKLEAVPEGNGSMMVNTVIVYTSDAGQQHHLAGQEWPFVVIGNVNKKLKAGRYIEYPSFGTDGQRSINALYCTLLHTAGHPTDHFNLEGSLKEVDRHGPLTELLA